MNGYAFRCDQCKRTTFVTDQFSGAQAQPPKEWFLVSQAKDEHVRWPTFHFCQFDCLVTFVNESAAGTSLDADVVEVLHTDPPDEVVISAWEYDLDQQEG